MGWERHGFADGDAVGMLSGTDLRVVPGTELRARVADGDVVGEWRRTDNKPVFAFGFQAHPLFSL